MEGIKGLQNRTLRNELLAGGIREGPQGNEGGHSVSFKIPSVVAKDWVRKLSHQGARRT